MCKVLLTHFNQRLETWKNNPKAQRLFFDKLAHTKGFDPVHESHRWYSVSKQDIEALKVSRTFTLSAYYGVGRASHLVN